MKTLLLVAAAAIGGAAALWALAWPEKVVRYERVEVPVERIIEREPEVEVRFVERLRVITPPPVQVAIAPGGAAPQVSSFCMPSVLQATADSITPVPDPQLLLRSVVHDPGWFFQRDRLLLTGPTSHGDLVAADYLVRPGFSARVSGDSVIVRYPRVGLTREALEFGFPLALGVVIALIVF
ncbi:hypothetical protein [Gaopeijia maritima]|uniref:hypothetical protein n=1 Tax=Gaopeijia maritima TaxID=3119007 RepID=UPI003293BA9B